MKWVDRIHRRMAEEPSRRGWVERVLHPEPEEPPPPVTADDGASNDRDGTSVASTHSPSRDTAPRRRSYNDRGDGIAPTTVAEIEAAERARRADQRAEAERQRETAERANGRMVAGAHPYPRKPGGGDRAGQRSRGRMLPPAPSGLPNPAAIRAMLLSSSWLTRSKRNDRWRLRTEAALCVVLAVEPGTPMTRICAMLPDEVLRLPLPPFAKRRVRKWLWLRAGWLGDSPSRKPSFLVPWLALPPRSNGKPRAIAWAIMRLLARRGAPCWRVRQLLRGPRWLESSTRC